MMHHTTNTNLIVSNVIVQKGSGNTTLHIAAQNDDTVQIQQLLTKCPDLNLEVANLDGKTALHEAAQHGQLKAIKLLLDAGCRVDSLKRSDWSPLMLATSKDNLDVIRYLIEVGNANINLRNKDGWTPFHIAARKGNAAITSYFMSKFGSDIAHTESKTKRTPLHTAALHGHIDIIKLIVSKDNNDNASVLVNCKDSCGTTPLMDAVRSMSLTACKLLIEIGADCFHTDQMGRNVLHVAAECNNIEAVDFFVNRMNFDRDIRDAMNGSTCLHIAAREGHEKMTNFLLNQLQVDCSVQDRKGRLPVEIAKLHKRINIFNALNNMEEQVSQ